MNRTIGRFLILGVVGLALFTSDRPVAQAQWPGWGGCCGSGYSYGVGYYPSYGYGLGSYSSFWPSSYYVGYSGYPAWSASYWPTSYWPTSSCCGGCGTSCCGGSWCGSGCSSGGCCGLGGCGGSCYGGGCGGSCYGGGCGSGCGLACGPDCCGGGCLAAGGAGCGATAAPAPGTKPKPTPEEGFVPRPYDPNAELRPNERPPRPATVPGAAGPPSAVTDPDAGTGRYARGRSGNQTKSGPADAQSDDFPSPTQKKATPPASTAPKDTDQTFEAKKPLQPIPQRADKKAPIAPPDDAADPAAPAQNSPSAKKPSAENHQPATSAPAITLQDRATWHLAGVSRPLFGRIANRPAPVPERLSSSSSADWAVFSADEAQVARR
jgi:hypothetical protein